MQERSDYLEALHKTLSPRSWHAITGPEASDTEAEKIEGQG